MTKQTKFIYGGLALATMLTTAAATSAFIIPAVTKAQSANNATPTQNQNSDKRAPLTAAEIASKKAEMDAKQADIQAKLKSGDLNTIKSLLQRIGVDTSKYSDDQLKEIGNYLAQFENLNNQKRDAVTGLVGTLPQDVMTSINGYTGDKSGFNSIGDKIKNLDSAKLQTLADVNNKINDLLNNQINGKYPDLATTLKNKPMMGGFGGGMEMGKGGHGGMRDMGDGDNDMRGPVNGTPRNN